MKNFRLLLASILLLVSALHAQQRVRLVVVISIDQFPYEYLPKYRSYFTEGGLSYFLNDGANFVNCLYFHASTLTAPGYAVIMSGTYGNVNGIVGNSWIDRSTNSHTYCVEDRSTKLLGTKGSVGRSPKNFVGATLGDQLKLHTNFQSKVISISNKDRAAILMVGKLADAAYWTMDSLFVTSSYYQEDLPDWVKSFNKSGRFRSYFGKQWDLLLPRSEYEKFGVDAGIGESDYYGHGKLFPHPVDGGNSKEITKAYSEALLASPYSAEILLDFSQEAIEQERLGQRGVTDLLCVALSSPDFVGHAFGPDSWEVMDLTVRMDRLLRKFFSFIDSVIGLENCIIVLTSDHGIAPIPELLTQSNPNMEAGRIPIDQVLAPALDSLDRKYGLLASAKEWIQAVEGGNIYFDPKALAAKGIDRETAAKVVKEAIVKLPFVAGAFTAAELTGNQVRGELADASRYSFYASRSGSVYVVLKPYYFYGDPQNPTGTTHGSPYSYDAHVPLLLAGPGIRPGTYFDRVSPADIAPTIAALLGVEMSPLTQGRILKEALR